VAERRAAAPRSPEAPERAPERITRCYMTAPFSIDDKLKADNLGTMLSATQDRTIRIKENLSAACVIY
jgi:hypothetical protein